MVLKQEDVPIRDGYDIGIGVAMATGSPMALGAVGQITPPEIGTGETGSFVFRRIETTEELESELHVGADVSAGIGLFSGSASFDFAKRCKIQSSSLTVLVSAEVRFAFQQMDSPSLSEAAAELKERGKPLDEQFGEYFVRGIKTGGRFFGVVRIDTKNSQSKTEVNAALEGSYGVMVTADIRTNISEAMKKAEARAEAFVLHDGGSITTFPRSGDPVELVKQLYKAMDEWSASVRSNPKAYAVTLAPYAIALGPTPPNQVDIEKQRRVLIRCAKLRSNVLDMINLVEYILDSRHADEFEIVAPPAGPDLPALQAALVGDIDVIEEAASFAIDNLKEARDPETFMREVRGVPDFRLTALPTNMPKQKPGRVDELTLTAAAHSFPSTFPRIELDAPDNFEATTRVSVNFGGPVSADFPDGSVAPRHVGIGLTLPGSKNLTGVALRIEKTGLMIGKVSGNLEPGAMFSFVGIPYFGNVIHLRIRATGGRFKGADFSEDGQTFTNTPGKMVGRITSTIAPPRKLVLFAWSMDDTPVVAQFAQPTIVITPGPGG